MEKKTTEELIGRLSGADFCIEEQPYATLFAIFQTCFLNQSVLRGVIRPGGQTNPFERRNAHRYRREGTQP